MDWDLKMPPWNLEELGRDAELSIGSVVVGSSGGGTCQSSGLDCSVDLKLGGLGDFGSSTEWNSHPAASMAMASQSAPSKRPRAPAHGVSCLVDGCNADLSKCREYHRRHKVCEAHSKTPMVVLRGQQQRFCQQCSRFHLLEEFDEVKRSCRKRLDGHNRRRRKPQPSSVNSGIIFPGHQVTGFSACPQIFRTAELESNWTRTVKTEDATPYTPSQFINHQHFPRSSYNFSKGRNQIPFIQDTKTAMDIKSTLQTSVGQLNPRTTTPSGSSGGSSSSKMFNNGLTQVFDSDCALSLLSSPTQTSDVSLSHMVPPADRIPMGQPLVSSLQYGSLMHQSLLQAPDNVTPTGFSCAGMEDQHTGTFLVPDHANDVEINCQNIYHSGCEGSSDATCQTLLFSWP
ncbi:unnamed protein product [Musa acuminata subsp. malaccensis]|uniref:(wild Malaysian banana) hypothetical protein n=1 Tax=Musa acuminata subsp. malaccensis TaxID=214687 RepID=A0A804HXB2_MUSAM|nr:PREDICTED: squamosa promoter-binding-like protein 16 isoform X1 [Musa acuminata subsp. malaccensis]CAG1860491.1 unnamed protein product [Musa acuminata subsp. malaccensis]